MDEIRGLILDMDGVLWKGSQPIGDLHEVFSMIHQTTLKFLLATNNSNHTPSQYRNKLLSFGADVPEDQIITSSHSVIHYLRLIRPDINRIFPVGGQGITALFLEYDFEIVKEKPDVVVVGLDLELSYKKLALATKHINQGALFIGTNPDKTYPTPKGAYPGAGALLAFLEASTGVTPIITGKPESYIYKLCLDKMQLDPDQILVVGDRLDTDIQGGQNVGCKTALVLSGTTKKDEVERHHPTPDLIFPDLISVLESLLLTSRRVP